MFEKDDLSYVCITKDEYTTLIECKIKYKLIVDTMVNAEYSSDLQKMVETLSGEKKED